MLEPFYSLALTSISLNDLPLLYEMMADHGWYCDKRQDLFVCFPFALVRGWLPVLKIHFSDSPFSSKCDLKFSIFSFNISLQEFVLRASPFKQPF